MKKLLAKLFLASLPLLTIIVIYICNDPFRVLYHYNNFLKEEEKTHISVDRDYVTTEMFLNNYGQYKYDSYIFGSSRSGYYFVNDWEKHIDSRACFHFDASRESLYGVAGKVDFLHSRHVRIKHALFIFDDELLGVLSNYPGPIYRKHPLISGEPSVDFQLSMFTCFLDADFITAYIRLLLTHKITKDMIEKGLCGNTANLHYDVAPNEMSAPGVEEMIARNSDSFYQSRAAIFYTRDTTTQQYTLPVIKRQQMTILTGIKKVLDEDNTEYKIIISPLYNQKKFDTTDLATLQAIFGKEHIYDFSGINDITRDKHNYYETSHYRPRIAAHIMSIIYGDTTSQNSSQYY